ncbi:glutamic acid-rich protein isoform X1 [Triplophysa rosa]|uniref:glutamic acid-rich protein isoform X1 n=1 Tax=Triplophysa rosa TaxID=992332 RepID=UPI002545F27E|nr:glutamic acid-rich protein isoform X1 [Triplophysa rosa]
MYKGFDSRLENENEDDKGSLSSSFWTDEESEKEDRKCFEKDNKKIVRELGKDSKTEEEHFVMTCGDKEEMKETLEGNMLEKDNCMQAETNPKADGYESEEERELFIDEDEKDKSTEKTRTETEEENEEEVEGEKSEEESKEENTETENEEEKGKAKESEEEQSDENKSEYEEEESEEKDTGTESEEENEEAQEGKESKEEESEDKIKNMSEYEEEDFGTESEEESDEALGGRKSKKNEKREAKSSNYKEDNSEEEDKGTQNKVEEIDLSETKRKMFKESEENGEYMSEDDRKEKSECFVSEETTENEKRKAQNDDSESEESESSKECLNSEEKCTDSLSEGEWSEEERESDEKRESHSIEISEENSDFPEQEYKDKDEGRGEERDNKTCASEDGRVVKKNSEDKSTENSEINKEYESKPNSDEEMSKQERQTDEEEESECLIKESTEEENEKRINCRGDKNNEEDNMECSVNDREIYFVPEIRNEEKGEYCISESSEEDLIERWPVKYEPETGVEEKKQWIMMMDDDAIDRRTAEQCTSVAETKDVPEGVSEDGDDRECSFDEAYACDITTVSPSVIEGREGCHQNQKSCISDDQEHDEDEQEKQQKETKEVEKEISEDFHAMGLGSPAASILTSGYGTYRPDSSNDGEEVDYRDDCTLAGLEKENDAQDYDDAHGPMWVKNNPSLETSKSEVPAEFSERHAPVTDSGRDVTMHDIDQSLEESEVSDSQPNQSPTECDNISSQNVCFDDIWEVAALRGNVDHPLNIRDRRSKGERRSKEKQYADGHDNDDNRRKEKRIKTYNGYFGTVSELEERLDHMQIGAPRVPYDSESEEAENYSDRSSSATDEAPSAFQDYIKGMTRSHSESDIRPRPKSFIRPVFDHPHTRNWKKSDPVAKYFQYKQEWEMFKPPGEKSRKELHWAIRERLLHQPPPPRPQKTYIPNNYVVPTEKKRSALRWEIRHDLAHGIIPKKPPTPDIEDVSLMPFTF